MSDPQPTPMADPPEGMTRPPARLPALVGDSALGERVVARSVRLEGGRAGWILAGRVAGESAGRTAAARGLLPGLALGLALAGLLGRFVWAARQGPRSP